MKILFPTLFQNQNTKVKVIKSDTENLAFYAYMYLQNELTIHFLSLKPRRDSQTLFMQLIADFISKAINGIYLRLSLKRFALQINIKQLYLGWVLTSKLILLFGLNTYVIALVDTNE